MVQPRADYDSHGSYELIRFIDWVLALPSELDEIFREELNVIEENDKMRYVTSFERLVLQEGIEQGIEQGIEHGMVQGIEQGIEQGIYQGSLLTARANILDILDLRFSQIPPELSEEIDQISDREYLKTLHRNAVLAGSLEEFERLVEQILRGEEE